MLIEHSQGDISINVDPGVTRVGIKLSGGADSAILMYLLGKYKAEERPDLVFVPMTNVCNRKPYNQIYADNIVDFVTKEFGIKFGEHLVIKNVEEEDFQRFHDVNIRMLYDNNIIQTHFMGITSLPPEGAMDMTGTHYIEGLDRTRTVKKPTKEGKSNRPFYNLDKKGIAELYDRFDLTDRLFPITRSCEAYTHDFSHHCGVCWWCRERQWAFGRLE